MNKDRRKALAAISAAIAEASGQLEILKEQIESERDDEQETFYNMPESFQQGEKGQRVEEAVSALDEAMEAIDQATSALDEVAGFIETASE